MPDTIFDDARFARGLPAPAPRFTGLPPYNFVGGHNDPTRIPSAALAEAAAAVVAREGPSLALYNLGTGPLGYRPLRDFVARKLRDHRGIAADPEEVLITSGSGQGLDLINRVLLGPPGERGTVLAEEYSYGGAIARLKGMGAEVVGVPLDEQGIRADALAAILEDRARRGQQAPRFLYTIPTIQNPTGSVLPAERREAILALARRHAMPVVEDECYADLIWAGGEAPRAFYGMDPAAVVHVGSFSKSLAPALRVGYLTARWPVLSRILACKSDGGTGALDQMVVAEYFARSFEAHTEGLAAALRAKLDTMVEALEREFGASAEFRRPEGGIFVWLRLPEGVDTRRLVAPAAARGIAFNPGPEWACAPEGAARSHMRLCFGLPSHEEIRAGVAALAQVCFEETGIPPRGANVERR